MSPKYFIPSEGQLEMLKGTAFDCQILHQGINCEQNVLYKFPGMFAYMAKLYLPIHLIPFLLYKRKQIMNSPGQTIGRSLVQYAKSILFLSLMVQFLRYNWCKMKNIRQKVDGLIPISGGFFGGLFLLMESNTRAQEIALSIVPRFSETIVNLLKSRNLIRNNIPYGDVIVFAFVIAIIHYYYQNEPKSLKETYFKVFQKMWGVN